MKSARRGITLTELLVAGILIGIVMLGVISVSFAIKKMQETTNKAALLAMRATGVVTHMTKNVAMAVGYQDDPGIVVDDDGVNQWVSIRQESGDDVGRFDDDDWFIYYTDIDQRLGDHRMYFCTQTNADGPVPQTWAGGKCDPDNSKTKTISQDLVNAHFQLLSDADNFEFFLRVFLETRYDPDPDVAEDPIDNPGFRIESQMSPVGHSW